MILMNWMRSSEAASGLAIQASTSRWIGHLGALLRECPPAAGAASPFISLRRTPMRPIPNSGLVRHRRHART